MAAEQSSSQQRSDHPVHKTLAGVANLANLLPTGSVLAFQGLTPSFSNNGSCHLSNKCLTACAIAFCAIFCSLSSFTDIFTDKDGSTYYGFATFNALYIFNKKFCGEDVIKDLEEEKKKFQLSLVDFVHAFVSPLVFMVFAATDSNVQSCFFPKAEDNKSQLMMNLPLGAGLLSSLLFTLFPTRRRGIGY